MDDTLLATHPSFAVLKKQDNELLFSLHGKVQLIRGAVPIIDAILGAVDSTQPKDEVLSRVSQHHPEAHIPDILNHMIGSGILITANAEASDAPANHGDKQVGASAVQLGCIGRGRLVDALCSHSSAPLQRIRPHNESARTLAAQTPEEALLAWTQAYEAQLAPLHLEALAVCPEGMSYLELCAINRACLNLRVPWVLGAFNGEECILGPSVLPFKTPCLECLLEHRLKALRPTLGVGWNDLLACTENFPLPATPSWQGTIHWAGWLMSAELSRLATSGTPPLYIQKQLHLARLAAPEPSSIAFEAITTCPACHGMNRDTFSTQPTPSPRNAKTMAIPLKKSTVRHGDNGLRSRSADDARAALDAALARLNTTVSITRCRGGALDDIIPSFRSCTDALYAPDVPFTVRARKQWGKGMNEKQAYLSAGFELMERICADYGTNVEIIQCPYKDVRDIAIDLHTRVGDQHYLRNIDKITEDTVVDWVWGWSLCAESPVLVPASMVFLTSSVFQGKFTMNGSSGLAAGTTLEDAVLQGLLETIEHDARSIWQANSVTTPRLTNLPQHIRDVSAQLQRAGFTLLFRDYSTDLGVYVFRAWLVQANNPVLYATSGFGASLRPEIALNRAISEAKQAWPSDPQTAPRHYASKNNTDLFGYNTPTVFMNYHSNHTEILAEGAETDYASLPDRSSGNISQDIRQILTRVRQGAPQNDVVAVNLTREELGIPVVRVIASGLQNQSQPLQNTPQNRVFTVPITLGLRDTPLSFKELHNDCTQE